MRIVTATLVICAAPLIVQCGPRNKPSHLTEKVTAAKVRDNGVGKSAMSGTQPFVEWHPFFLEPRQCFQNRECPDPDICNRGVCAGGKCSKHVKNYARCVANFNGVSTPGMCFAGQCVSASRWAEACGRVIGSQNGRFLSIAYRTYELGQCPGEWNESKCITEAINARRIISVGGAKDLIHCLQYPNLELPEGYLYNWDGNDPTDYRGKASRQP